MQVSWIEADDIKGLLARIAPPVAAPAPPSPPAEGSSAARALAEPENPFIFTGLDEPIRDPFDAIESASSFVDSQPALAEPKPAAPSPTPPSPTEEDVHQEPEDDAPAALPLSRIRDKLRAIRQRANEAGILAKTAEAASSTPATPASSATQSASSTTPPPALAPFEPPAGSRRERLAAFAGWARQILHEDGGHLLVMTDDGELLWGGEAKASLVLSAMMAWSANLRSSALSACGDLPVMRQALASGHQLTVIPCATAPGAILHVAVAAPASLPVSMALELRQALLLALR